MSGLVQVFLHINFHTRENEPWITQARESELLPFWGKLLLELDCKLIQGGAAPDHAHLLIQISHEFSIQELIRRLKGASSHWIHRRWPELKDSGWQIGYAAFSVDPKALKRVARYIQGQREHHGYCEPK